MTSAHSTPIEVLLAEQKWLHELARQLVRDPDVALDLEQETWLAALRSPPRYADGARGWLATVLRRLARRRAEAERHGREREAEVARAEALPGAAAGVARAETILALVEATLALEEPFRETVLLRYFEGLEPSVIAERMGVPASTVRSRLVRAHGKLREALIGRVEEDDLFGAGWIALLAGGWNRVRERWSLATPAFVVGVATLVIGVWWLVPRGDGAAEATAARAEQVGPLVASADGSGGPREMSNEVAELADSRPAAVEDSARVEVQGEAVAGPERETVTGTLLSSDGRPVVGGRVAIWTEANATPALGTATDLDADPAGRRVLELESDAQGRFEVPFEYVGERDRQRGSTPYFVRCETPGYTPDVTSLERGRPIELRPEWLVRFDGRVLDAESGQPIAGVAVDYGPGRHSATSDPAGRFSIPDVPATQGLSVQLQHPDYVFSEAPVALAGPEPGEFTFELERGVGLDVRFVDAQTGRGVPGVRLFHERAVAAGPVADADGLVRLRLAEGSAWVLSGEADGHANFRWNVARDELAGGCEVRFPMRASTSMQGQVLDAEGRPVAGAVVQASPVERAAAAPVPGLPGTVAYSLRPERATMTPPGRTTTDTHGRFQVGLLEGEGPWTIWAFAGKRRTQVERFESPDVSPRLVLQAEIVPVTVSGRLVRGGEVWGVATYLALQGASSGGARSESDGRFEIEVRQPGIYDLTLAHHGLRRIEVDGSATALELGDVALDDLPLLSLRCETPAGAPWAHAELWIHALRPGEFAPLEQEDLPASGQLLTLDADGRCDVLLPHSGGYVVRLMRGTALAVEELRVDGDTSHVLRVDEPRRIELRLVDADTLAPIPLGFEWSHGLLGWRRPGELEVTYIEPATHGVGSLAFDVPGGPIELSLRPWGGEYRSQVVDAQRLATVGAGTPIEVRLQRGFTLELTLEGLDAAGDGVRFVLLNEADLELVRAPLSRAEAAVLAARGESTRYLDHRLWRQMLHPAPGERSLQVRGLDAGRYTTVAFDAHGRRPDVQLQPESFAVGPDVAKVLLTLAPR